MKMPSQRASLVQQPVNQEKHQRHKHQNPPRYHEISLDLNSRNWLLSIKIPLSFHPPLISSPMLLPTYCNYRRLRYTSELSNKDILVLLPYLERPDRKSVV